jgi:hypothetical protein
LVLLEESAAAAVVGASELNDLVLEWWLVICGSVWTERRAGRLQAALTQRAIDNIYLDIQ